MWARLEYPEPASSTAEADALERQPLMLRAKAG